MALVQIDVSEIADLVTLVAVSGALGTVEATGLDDLFDFVVGIAVLIYEMAP